MLKEEEICYNGRRYPKRLDYSRIAVVGALHCRLPGRHHGTRAILAVLQRPLAQLLLQDSLHQLYKSVRSAASPAPVLLTPPSLVASSSLFERGRHLQLLLKLDSVWIQTVSTSQGLNQSSNELVYVPPAHDGEPILRRRNA
jgi:hypothetical protein